MATSAAHTGTSINNNNATVNPVSAGNFMVAAVSWDPSTVGGSVANGCTDGLGNTYSLVDTCHDTTSSQDLTVYTSVLTNPGSAAVNFTWTGSAPTSFRANAAMELTGMAGTVRDQTNKTVHGSAATGADGMVSAAITPTTSGQTIIAVGEDHGTLSAQISPGTGYTEATDTFSLANSPVIQQEFLDQGAAASITGKWTITTASTNFNAIIFSLSAGAAAPPAPAFIPHRMPLGV